MLNVNLRTLDKDAGWKLFNTPLKTVISYLQSFPDNAVLVEDVDPYNGEIEGCSVVIQSTPEELDRIKKYNMLRDLAEELGYKVMLP